MTAMAETGPSVNAVEEAYRHCEQLVRTYDKDRFLASLYAPVERRRFLFALYAFALEIGRVQRIVREPMAGMIRLQWWLEAIAGLRAEEAAASPVMLALQDASRQTGVALAPLTAAIEARQAELSGAAPIGAASAVFEMGAHFLAPDADVQAVAAEAANAVTFVAEPRDPVKAKEGYRAFRKDLATIPEGTLPVFLTVALVPLLLKQPAAAQWRRQLALLRAAYFGFPEL